MTDFFRLWSLIVNIVKLSHSLRNLSSSFFFLFFFFCVFYDNKRRNFPLLVILSLFHSRLQFHVETNIHLASLWICNYTCMHGRDIGKWNKKISPAVGYTVLYTHVCIYIYIYIYTFHNLVSQLSKVLI